MQKVRFEERKKLIDTPQVTVWGWANSGQKCIGQRSKGLQTSFNIDLLGFLNVCKVHYWKGVIFWKMRSANKVGIWEACVQFEAASNCKSFQLQKSATNLFQESTSLSVWVSETRTHPNCLQILVFTGQRTFWNTSKFNLNQDFYLLKIRWNFRNPWSRSTTPEIHGQSQDKVQRQLVGSIEMKGEMKPVGPKKVSAKKGKSFDAEKKIWVQFVKDHTAIMNPFNCWGHLLFLERLEQKASL